jgi:sulfhydrogenase subunit beta (sulfur reductase)
MAEAKYLHQDKLSAWLDGLTEQMRVLAPVKQGDAVVFAAYEPGKAMELHGQATAPPKSVVFPASEELLRYTYQKSPEQPGLVDVELLPVIAPEPTLVFGCRPCDARGFAIFDRVYDGQMYKDPYYIARKEATLFATLACLRHENSCFCHSVGAGPGDSQGSDLLLTPLADGYVVEAVSNRADELLNSALLEPAGEKAGQAKALRDQALENMGDPTDFAPAREKLMALFDDMNFWEEIAAKCISCGACTYLCPTCYCFNITDEGAGMSGRRVRSWDNCMSHQFTLEASGHNPRPTKAHRLKNRVGHKFSYYPALHDGLISCCGCGRCIKSCPVSVDIREIVAQSMAYTAPAAEESGS